ncbi:MAG: hypothetical protein EBR23_11140, partial [Planctomycetia bacterium]|nr:hypothetical protein [Planctomycetia bacterium]
MARQFCTLRNLWVHRGVYGRDSVGYAWGGIYRSLLVRSIVTTSYRNEGHLRAGHRIFGTGDFFRGGFVLPVTSAAFRELMQLVNLRHHVAGVVVPHGAGVRVLEGYEADYAYVATSFIESIRRGFAVCGLPPHSARGRDVGTHFYTLLYQLAGFTGLTRIPRDLAAHDLQSRQRSRDISARSLQAGMLAPAAYAQVQAEVAQSQLRLTQQASQCALYTKAMVALTGEDEALVRSVMQERTWSDDLAGFSVEQVPAQALVQRPDVFAAEHDVALASAQIGRAKARRWPGLTLGGSV